MISKRVYEEKISDLPLGSHCSVFTLLRCENGAFENANENASRIATPNRQSSSLQVTAKLAIWALNTTILALKAQITSKVSCLMFSLVFAGLREGVSAENLPFQREGMAN